MQIPWARAVMSGGNSRLFCSSCGTPAGKRRRQADVHGGATTPGRACFTQNGGTYVADVNAQGQNDRVTVAGTAIINGATVQVLATPGNYATSTPYTIPNATGGVSGTYAGVSSNYAFMTPSLAYDANNIFLTLALQGAAPFSGFGSHTVNQRNVDVRLQW